MKKKFLFLFCICLTLFVNGQTNQQIATGIAAESFSTTIPVDSLNILTPTQKVNGVGVWKKVNLGSIKTWINTQSVIDGTKDYGPELNLNNSYNDGKIKIEALNGQYNIVELSTGVTKFRVNKLAEGFDFWNSTNYFTLRSGESNPSTISNPKSGDLYIQTIPSGGLWQYVNGNWSKIGVDLTNYVTKTNLNQLIRNDDSHLIIGNTEAIGADLDGSYNTIIGNDAFIGGTGDNTIAIGNGVCETCSGDGNIVIGNGLSVNGNDQLNIGGWITGNNGTITIPILLRLTQGKGLGKILTSDGDGHALWKSTLLINDTYTKSAGNIYLESNNIGVIQKSANGSCWKIIVSDTGAISTVATTCPN